MIHAEHISKYFGRTKALNDVSFDVAKGEIIGFLGANGAGKTTLMRVLTGYFPVSSGRVEVAGMDVGKDSLKARAVTGYLPEIPPLYTNMTVEAYLKFAAELKGVPVKQVKLQTDKVISLCNLESVRESLIGNLSKGYKQRVGIAQAVINDPQLLILDEPTVGLDPEQILQVRSLIKSMENKTTVILSTHILSEIEQLVKRVFIMRSGKIVADRPLKDLLDREGVSGRMLLTVKGDWAKVDAVVANTLKGKQTKMTRQDDVLFVEFTVAEDIKDFNALTEQLHREEITILELRKVSASLEDAYFKIISEN